jgi:hypothetical protein
MGKRYSCDPGSVLRLCVSQSSKRCRREGYDRHHPGAAGILLRTNFGDQVKGSLCAARIIPQQRRSDDPSQPIQPNHAVLLGRNRHRRHVVKPAGGVDRSQRRLPSCTRINLRAFGMRRPPGAHEHSCRKISNNHLATLCRRVNTPDERHSTRLSGPREDARAPTGSDAQNRSPCHRSTRPS